MVDRVLATPLAPSAQRHRMVHPWLTAETYAVLLSAAKKRDTHVDRLAATILTVLVDDKLVDAVLDDAGV